MFRYKLRGSAAGLGLILLLGCGVGPGHAADGYATRSDVRSYIDRLVSEHGFSQGYLNQLLLNANHREDIIAKISRPAERVWTWGKYKAHLVDERRIAEGLAFWRQHDATLRRAEQQYGVAPEYILAILGIETRYGSVTGSYPVIDALMTLGFDYPPRSSFFRKELTEFLMLTREEGKDPRDITGSYAGAMGYGQFIPSSYRHYAVDFDADGVRDIWSNPVDAIGSIANYLAEHDWRGTHPVALPVSISRPLDGDVANTQLPLKHTVGELVSLGVVLPDTALSASLPARVYELQGAHDTEHWLVLHDFYVITRYNHSHLYALAVHHIAEAIKRRSTGMASL